MMIPNIACLFRFVAASPVDSVRQTLIANSDRWFFWLVASSVVVGVGVCLEAPEATITLRRWFRHWKGGQDIPPENARSLAIPASYLGLLVVILGVGGEGVFEGLSSNAETALRAHDEQVLAETIERAGAAKDSADSAANDAMAAGEQSDEAVAGATKALTLATGARREADSFEQDIQSAKKQAANAESHLNEALQRAAEATAELNRLTTPRTLSNSEAIAAELKAYSEAQYKFGAVCGDTECVNLLRQIDGALRAAGWKRLKSPNGFPGLTVFGADDSVPISVEPGVVVSVESAESSESLNKAPSDILPVYIRAAKSLRAALTANILPTEKVENTVRLGTGTSTVITVSVGRKL